MMLSVPAISSSIPANATLPRPRIRPPSPREVTIGRGSSLRSFLTPIRRASPPSHEIGWLERHWALGGNLGSCSHRRPASRRSAVGDAARGLQSGSPRAGPDRRRARTAQFTRFGGCGGDGRSATLPSNRPGSDVMCRWMAWMGQSVLIDELLFKTQHGIVDQSLHSRMGAETTNGDGFGLGWYGAGEGPGVYHSVAPAWGNANLRELAAHVASPLFLVHVRAAIGSPIQGT